MTEPIFAAKHEEVSRQDNLAIPILVTHIYIYETITFYLYFLEKFIESFFKKYFKNFRKENG